MITFLGMLAGLCFGYAAVAAALATLRARRALGTPLSICIAVFSGTVLMYIYLFCLNGFDPLLTAVYSVEAISWGVLLIFALLN